MRVDNTQYTSEGEVAVTARRIQTLQFVYAIFDVNTQETVMKTQTMRYMTPYRLVCSYRRFGAYFPRLERSFGSVGSYVPLHMGS